MYLYSFDEKTVLVSRKNNFEAEMSKSESDEGK